MNLKAFGCNLAWFASQAPAFYRFLRALDRPAETQEAVLFRILRENAASDFGRRHGFSSIRTIRDFHRHVALSSYADYEPWIARIRAGETGVLTSEPVRRLVPTSGSSSAVKLIPSTAASQREFAAAIGPWIFDLFSSDPELTAGTAFWSITPSMQLPKIDSDVPIGFDEDTEYLGATLKALVDATLAVPGSVSRGADIRSFRRKALVHLLNAADLRLISVWHPSFLTLLMDAMRNEWDLLLSLARDSSRREQLRACGPQSLQEIWPRLKLISCWGDGPAAMAAASLRKRFPHVPVQAKGLLATEAFVTIPFGGAHPLAVRSHFFEFLDDRREPILTEDLQDGSEYCVVVTTAAGLYRYRLGDRIKVVGRLGRTPSLQFVGREQGVVDFFGEKLSESFAARELATVLTEHKLEVKFAMLVPEITQNTGQYILCMECDSECPETLAQGLEQRFRSNPHYDLCVSLGQLQPLRVERVPPGAFERYLAWCSHKGLRIGNVKPAMLCGDPGLAPVLRHPVHPA